MRVDVSLEMDNAGSARSFNRRRFLAGASAAVATPALVTAWGYDPDRLTTERYQVSVPGLERPIVAVQISDLHADLAGSCSELLRQRVEAQIQQLRPDLILATGDFVTIPGDSIEEATRWVGGLYAPLGTYAVLGNHDSQAVIPALRHQGIAVLDNTWTKLHGMALAGVGDLSRGAGQAQEALKPIPRRLSTILMAHQPDAFWTYQHPVVLQVSGHTHGGQATLFGTISAPGCSQKCDSSWSGCPDSNG